MAAAYTAFRHRRSLLLVNLEHQVRFEELPWVKAVEGYRDTGDHAGQEAMVQVLRHLAELALQGWPATVLPNALVRELGTLARTGGITLPLVEELAADIFTGTFTPKFLAAAKDAGALLDGTLYAAYYDIDYAAVAALDASPGQPGRRDCPEFSDLCRTRADITKHRWPSVAEGGMVIEQAQILTTHNLATLAGPVGARPEPGWADLARRSFTAFCRLIARLHGNPHPLTTVKDAAYAWRQALFYLSLAEPGEQTALVSWLGEETTRQPEHIRARLAPVAAGLRLIHAGGAFGTDGTLDDGAARRFLGWDTRHWMLATPSSMG